MCPGADGQRDVDAAAAQMPVLPQRLPHEDVLPAAQQQHRNLHAVQRLGEPPRIPKRIVHPGMFDPRFEPGRARAEQRPGRGTHRHRAGRLGHPASGLQLAECDPPARVLLVGNQVAPAQKVVDGERAGAPHRGIEIVGTRGDHGRGQLRRRILQHRPLGESQIRHPDGGESAGKPRLFTQPYDRVGAIDGLVDHRLEHPARPERPAHALHHDVIAARRVEPPKHQGERKPPPVGAADQHGADRAGSGRRVVVGHQVDPVAHRDFDAIHRVLGPRRGQAQQAAKGVVAEALGQRAQHGRHGSGGCRTHDPRLRPGGPRTCSKARGRWPAAGWWTGNRPRGWSRSSSSTALAGAPRSWS